MEVDKVENRARWTGLPLELAAEMVRVPDEEQQADAFAALKKSICALNGRRERPLLSHDEVSQLIDQLSIRRENPSRHYKILKRINVKTYTARSTKDNHHFAIKSVPEPPDDKSRQELMHEIFALGVIFSPNKVTYVDAFVFKAHYFLVMELLEGGSIAEVVRAGQGTYSEAFCKYTVYGVANGLKALHDLDVIHHDIQSINIQCSLEGDVKIADFSRASVLTREEKFKRSGNSNSGEVELALSCPAPEIAFGSEYGLEVDIWSLGVMAYELATGSIPSDPNNIMVDLPPRISAPYQSFIQRCLQVDPRERPGINQLL